MIAIDLRRIIVRFGAAIALDRVDLEVSRGELLLLVGPSGCGKSTLLRTIAGFVAPNEGGVFFDGEDITRQKPHERSTGMVFQSFALWPHMSVAENVAFGLRERRVDKGEIARRVDETLDTVRLGTYGRRRIDELSGGEQQRVALARALVVKPRCLLLDEPLSNLDASLRRSMREEIRRVCKDSGLTAVYVTHDQEEALAIADRIAVMMRGRILQIDAPAEVYRRPTSRAVASFFGETNLLEGTVTAISTSQVRVRTRIGEIKAHPHPERSPAEGLKVWVSLRPECFSFGSGASPQHNALPGAIESTTYLGSIAEHRFRSGSEILRVQEMNPSFATPNEPREGVLISQADVVLLPFDEDV